MSNLACIIRLRKRRKIVIMHTTGSEHDLWRFFNANLIKMLRDRCLKCVSKHYAWIMDGADKKKVLHMQEMTTRTLSSFSLYFKVKHDAFSCR